MSQIDRISPCTLEVLIHCHVSPMMHPRVESQSVKESIQLLQTAGLIERDDRHHATTAKGKFYLEHLLATPFPERTFHIPERV